MRVPSGSSNTSARSSGQNSPSWLPSGVIFTLGACGSGAVAQAASARPAMAASSSLMGMLLLVFLRAAMLHQHDIELFLGVARLHLHRDRLADEVRQHAERAGLVFEEKINHRLRGDHPVLARVEGARLAQQLAQDVV